MVGYRVVYPGDVYPAKRIFRVDVFRWDDGEKVLVLAIIVDMFEVDGGQISWSLAHETKTHFFQGAQEHVGSAVTAIGKILLEMAA